LIKHLRDKPEPWTVVVDPDRSVVESMPIGSNTRILFRKFSTGFMGEELENVLDRLKLKPADPYLLGRFNIEIPRFCEKYPHFTCWRRPDRSWCHMSFFNGDSGRTVHIVQCKLECVSPHMWVATVPK
jgi:hypothetical protein